MLGLLVDNPLVNMGVMLLILAQLLKLKDESGQKLSLRKNLEREEENFSKLDILLLFYKIKCYFKYLYAIYLGFFLKR